MIRKATVEDSNRLAEIHITGWRFAYRNLIPDDYLFRTMEVVTRAKPREWFSGTTSNLIPYRQRVNAISERICPHYRIRCIGKHRHRPFPGAPCAYPALQCHWW